MVRGSGVKDVRCGGDPVCTSEALRPRKIGEGPDGTPEGILDAAGDFIPLRLNP